MADTTSEKKQRGIQSVEVGGRLLQALARQREPLGLTELAGAAQLSSAQAHTYLVSLTRLGLVKRDALTGNYEPGPLSLRLGLMHIEQQPVYRIAAPHAAALAERIGLCVAICVAGVQGPTIVRYERSGAPLHVNLHIGTVMSLEATSTGRVFCAFCAPQQVAEMARSQAQSADSTPPRGRAAKGPANAEWRKRFDEIRARGIERGIDVPSPGISSLSVPVFDGDQRMQLALTAIGSSGSIDVAWDGAVARQLLETSRRITETLVTPT
ncbi:IclR family transcriptional regulator [Paraburkholderia sp. UYCP14C]|uniref:IclR family transcriptional regulator n=1 Tax=Paraburkholderia sp. UYCP14C TaxID=2511130 RepID=UPI0010201278|nr:IclR family transcriptional regulator [Paraburkholderia sp. UYCP14C]RZF24882.1 IclR family transcriptional regulator [Paraburkholderia sp. UYCP14C]